MKKLFSIVLIISALFFTTGCIKIKTSGSGVNVGGLFVSMNKGDLWAQKSLIPTASGKPQNFGGVDIKSITIDPSDYNAIYFGGIGNGMFYTYDGAENWRIANTLSSMTINSIAVDPNSKCIIYVSVNNEVIKSTDCARTWNRVYYDNDLTAYISSIAIDHYDSNNIYIAINRGNTGDITKSSKGGEGWSNVHRINGGVIRSLIVDKKDSRVLYATTNTQGIYRTLNSGDNWSRIESLDKAFQDYKLGNDIKDISISYGDSRTIYVATYYGLLKSDNDGMSWDKIKLIPPEQKAAINAIVSNPNNYKEIYYVTNTTFYRSVDGGDNWTPIKMPTSRAGAKLLINPGNTDIIYMGVRTVK